MRGIWTIGLVLTALLAIAGCSVKRPPKATAPATAMPSVASLPGQEETAPQATSGSSENTGEATLNYERVVVPPLQPSEPEEPDTSSENTGTDVPAETKPRPTKRPAPVVNAKAPETEAPVEPDPAKVNDLRAPSLKPMLSESERRQLDDQINTNLDRVRKNFSLIREARLGANERGVLEEARSFAARADQLRRSDPAVANSLAERAAILTQELLRKQ